MKKMVFKKELEEKKKKNQRLMTVFIVGIMALSTLGFALSYSNPGEKIKYGSIKFYKTEKGWNPKGYNILTSYLPQDVENFSFLKKNEFDLNPFHNKVYLISPPYLRNYASEFFYNIPTRNLQYACLEKDANLSYCLDLPLKNCNDSSYENAMLIIEESQIENESSMEYSNYCLKIKGHESDIIKFIDRFIFSVYGIME